MIGVVAMLTYHVSRRGSAPPEQGFSFYTDHYRHMRFAWESLSIGPRVYVTPMRDFAFIGEPLAYNWVNTEYLYPPGALLAFLPFALLTYGGVLPFTPVATGLVCLFALAAAHASVRLWREGLARSVSFERYFPLRDSCCFAAFCTAPGTSLLFAMVFRSLSRRCITNFDDWPNGVRGLPTRLNFTW